MDAIVRPYCLYFKIKRAHPVAAPTIVESKRSFAFGGLIGIGPNEDGSKTQVLVLVTSAQVQW